MQTRTGIPASPGSAIAQAIILDSEEYGIPQRHIDSDVVPAEIDRTKRAFDEAIRELAELETQQWELGKIEIRGLTSNQFSDFSTFRELTSSISELALAADQEEIEDTYTKDDLFIIPIVDEEREVIGRSVFAFVR